MKQVVFLSIILLFLLTSCDKGELPVSKHDPGDVTAQTVNIDATYKWQIYYNLKTNTVVGQNLKTIWDLGFETGPQGWHIILNQAKFMFVYNTGKTVFEEVVDTNGFSPGRRWDAPSGDYDSTAIGYWQDHKAVYIVDGGYSETGVQQGFYKVQFLAVDNYSYTLRFSKINGTNDTTMQIIKDNTCNYTFLSLKNSKTVLVEPPKDTWDLVFSQYTHVFNNPIEPYLVSGCLLNKFQTSACSDSSKSFAAINFENISDYTFTSAVNSIGYNWKKYDNGTYVTNPRIVYIIKDSHGLYYKLHFIDFYNQSGVKGNPKWEYQKM